MTARKFITVMASVTVVIAVLGGLYVSGSPGEQRLLRLDERRIADLVQLSAAISAYWQQSGRLPAALPVLVDGQRLRSLPTDPQTEVVYSYEPADMNTYQLCAEFARVAQQTMSEDFWAHPAGTHCFELEVGPEREVP